MSHTRLSLLARNQQATQIHRRREGCQNLAEVRDVFDNFETDDRVDGQPSIGLQAIDGC